MRSFFVATLAAVLAVLVASSVRALTLHPGDLVVTGQVGPSPPFAVLHRGSAR